MRSRRQIYHIFFFYCYRDPRDLHSFPTRRSSDLLTLPPEPAPLLHPAATQVFCLDLAERGFARGQAQSPVRSEEHTSELQSHVNLVCRLLLEKKKKKKTTNALHSNIKSLKQMFWL